jgi:hypothetical protein
MKSMPERSAGRLTDNSHRASVSSDPMAASFNLAIYSEPVNQPLTASAFVQMI